MKTPQNPTLTNTNDFLYFLKQLPLLLLEIDFVQFVVGIVVVVVLTHELKSFMLLNLLGHCRAHNINVYVYV